MATPRYSCLCDYCVISTNSTPTLVIKHFVPRVSKVVFEIQDMLSNFPMLGQVISYQKHKLQAKTHIGVSSGIIHIHKNKTFVCVCASNFSNLATVNFVSFYSHL